MHTCTSHKYCKDGGQLCCLVDTTAAYTPLLGFDNEGILGYLRPLVSHNACEQHRSMRFDQPGLSSAPLSSAPAFVPVLYHVRASRSSSSRVEETKPRSLQAANLDASGTRTIGKWPWVFKNPGRFVDLPAEEVFSGFEGLLFDDVSETESEDDQTYSKVRVSPQLEE